MPTDQLTVSLDDCRFFARHGVMEQELRSGNEFTVSIHVAYDWLHSANSTPSDELYSTISYADLYEIAKEEMAVPRQLLETVACRIADRIETTFPIAREVSVKVCKLTPPIAGINGTASVELKRLI